MARKLKTYVTTSGFYDLAVAAPSMKAALQIWGSNKNLFHQGFAKETEDAGHCCRHTRAARYHSAPRGWDKGCVQAERGIAEARGAPEGAEEQAAGASGEREPKAKKQKQPKKADAAATRKAAQLYDLAEKRREREQARAEAQEVKERERREQAMDKAKAALDGARAAHEERLSALDDERATLEDKHEKEVERWESEKEKLEAALDRARD